jgi:hypothetical protein
MVSAFSFSMNGGNMKHVLDCETLQRLAEGDEATRLLTIVYRQYVSMADLNGSKLIQKEAACNMADEIRAFLLKQMEAPQVYRGTPTCQCGAVGFFKSDHAPVCALRI